MLAPATAGAVRPADDGVGGCAHGATGAGWLDPFEDFFSSLAQLFARPPKAPGPRWMNPIMDTNCPDPGVLKDGDRWVMACTRGGAGGAFELFTSSDMFHWTDSGSAIVPPSDARWGTSDFWAPEVHKLGPHDYLALYTARDAAGHLGIGVATASDPLGPWKDAGAPIVPGTAEMGYIDATLYDDGHGHRWLYYKADGNAVGKPSVIYAAPLSKDGLRVTGPAKPVLQNDLGWEDKVVEAPEVVRHGDWYYLFYSGNCYCNEHYAVGVARSKSPTGPFEKKGDPILKTGDLFAGPGHGSVTKGPDGRDWFVYHAYGANAVGDGHPRQLLADPITWGDDGWPSFAGGTPSAGSPL